VNRNTDAIVLFGDVVGSRRAPAAASAWLRSLCRQLEILYATGRLATFAFTQGDELQGLLKPSADPLRAVLFASLQDDSRPMRWVAVHGEVVSGEGPATERGGEAFLQARAALDQGKRHRDSLVMLTGDAPTDQLLADLAPVLAELLGGLTRRQRTVARLALVDGLRQAQVAERLNVSRATISVTYARGAVRSIERLASAIRTLFAAGVGSAGVRAGAS
jgi:ATP/maltotriose-dependent transcriptional regulator MalT